MIELPEKIVMYRAKSLLDRMLQTIVQLLLKRDWLWKASVQNEIHSSFEVTGMNKGYCRISMGVGSTIEADVVVWISGDENAQPDLAISDRVFIGRNCYIGTFKPISIGSFVMIGAYCYIISANHRYESREVPIRDQGYTGAPIVIEDDVWLGTHVVVLPGVTIGKGAVVAAGAVVNTDIPPYEVWGGVPAKFLKQRP